MSFWKLMFAWWEQVALGFDQFLNTLPPPIDGTIGYADETLSARCYRAHRDGKRLGLWFMPPIDWVFGLWQGPNHCRNAYIKEFERKNYPTEYHGGVPIFESRSVRPMENGGGSNE